MCDKSSRQCIPVLPKVSISSAGVTYFIPRSEIFFKLLQLLIGAIVLLFGLCWGLCERRRRARLAALLGRMQPARSGGYLTGLLDCFRHLRVCLPACLFTPVLAAFNRAEVDDRECTGFDVCFAMVKPMAQYTTRQSIRGKYGLEDNNVLDTLSACCCTPCAVAQDTLELEKRASQDHLTVTVAPGLPVTGTAGPVAEPVPSCPAYELVVETSKLEAAQDQV